MSLFFSDTLRKLRTETGLSQQALADKMYVTRSTVVRWETGSRLPDAAMIARLSEVLDVDVNMLLSAAAQSDECPNVIMVDDRKLILTGGLPILVPLENKKWKETTIYYVEEGKRWTFYKT